MAYDYPTNVYIPTPQNRQAADAWAQSAGYMNNGVFSGGGQGNQGVDPFDYYTALQRGVQLPAYNSLTSLVMGNGNDGRWFATGADGQTSTYNQAAPQPFNQPQQAAAQPAQQTGGAMAAPAQYQTAAYNPYMVQQPYQQQPAQQYANPYNPYLANQMASTVADYSRQFLEQINPALESQAIIAGGYGGDRANLAKATAAGNTQQNIASAIANMQSQNWQAGQQYGLQAGSLDLQRELGLGNLSLGQQRLGLDTELGRGGLANQSRGLDIQQQLGQGQLANAARGLDIQQQLGLGGLANQSRGLDIQRELGQGQLGLGYYNADTSRMLGEGQLANASRGLDIQQLLGLGGLENQRYATDINAMLGMGNLGLGYTQAANQYNLGLGNLGLGYTQAANQYDLGQQNVGLGYAGLGNQYNIAQMGNDTTRLGQMLNYDLGLGNQGINEFNAQVNAQRGFNQDQLAAALGFGNLGVNQFNSLANAYNNAGQLDLGSYNADTQRMLGMGNLGISAGQLANQTQQINNNWDLGNRTLDANILQQLMGNDLGWAQNYNQYYGNTIPNLMNANTSAAGQPVYTNPLGSAIGGGLTLAQLLGMLGG